MERQEINEKWLNEWLNQSEIENSYPIAEFSLNHIRKRVQLLYESKEKIEPPFPFFTPHSIEHLMAVERNIILLLGDNHKKLTTYEKYFLLGSAWLHDIGMFIKLFPEDEKDTDYIQIRENHHVRSEKYITEYWSNCGIKEHEVTIFAVLAKYHRRKMPISKCKETIGSEYGNIRLRLLASYLRLADSLHVDITRAPAPAYAISLSYNIPDFNKIHWIKSKFVLSVEISPEKHQIVLHLRNPLLEEDNDVYDKITIRRIKTLHNLILSDINEELISVKEVLIKEGITYFLKISYEEHRVESDHQLLIDIKGLLTNYDLLIHPSSSTLVDLVLDTMHNILAPSLNLKKDIILKPEENPSQQKIALLEQFCKDLKKDVLAQRPCHLNLNTIINEIIILINEKRYKELDKKIIEEYLKQKDGKNLIRNNSKAFFKDDFNNKLINWKVEEFFELLYNSHFHCKMTLNDNEALDVHEFNKYFGELEIKEILNVKEKSKIIDTNKFNNGIGIHGISEIIDSNKINDILGKHKVNDIIDIKKTEKTIMVCKINERINVDKVKKHIGSHKINEIIDYTALENHIKSKKLDDFIDIGNLKKHIETHNLKDFIKVETIKDLFDIKKIKEIFIAEGCNKVVNSNKFKDIIDINSLNEIIDVKINILVYGYSSLVVKCLCGFRDYIVDKLISLYLKSEYKFLLHKVDFESFASNFFQIFVCEANPKTQISYSGNLSFHDGSLYATTIADHGFCNVTVIPDAIAGTLLNTDKLQAGSNCNSSAMNDEPINGERKTNIQKFPQIDYVLLGTNGFTEDSFTHSAGHKMIISLVKGCPNSNESDASNALKTKVVLVTLASKFNSISSNQKINSSKKAFDRLKKVDRWYFETPFYNEPTREKVFIPFDISNREELLSRKISLYNPREDSILIKGNIDVAITENGFIHNPQNGSVMKK